jgi:intracellular multiplication protein IcmQ
MKEELNDQQVDQILNALNEAIEKGPWDKTNFLKLLGKNLIEVRDGFLQQLGTRSDAQVKADTQKASITAERSTRQEVFVSVYCSDGTNIHSWERVVFNLPRQSISRPIYSAEEDIQAAIKAKENKINEAYVGFYINPSDILTLSPDKTAMDKLGKGLLNLKDRSLSLEHLSRFVHQTGVYHMEHGHLVKM